MSEHRKHPAADEEKGILLKAAQKLGLTLSSMEYDGRGTHIAKALKQDSNRKTTSLIAYVTSKHRTGSHKLRVLSKTLERDGLESLYVLSKAGYTEDAMEYSRKNDIKLLDVSDYQTEDSKALAEPTRHKIFDRVFRAQMTLARASEEFEKRRKKSVLGLFGSDEKIESVSARYAPVGCYKLRKRESRRLLSDGKANDSNENMFWVNLNTCQIYFVFYGLTGGNLSLKSSNILRRMMDLPETSVLLFSEIFESETLHLDRMSPEQMRFLEANAAYLLALESMDLVSRIKGGNAIVSTVRLSKFNDQRFDLGKYVESDSMVESENPVDEIIYPSNGILELLKDFYNAEGEFMGVTYLPYFRCKYVDQKNSIRYEKIESITYKNG